VANLKSDALYNSKVVVMVELLARYMNLFFHLFPTSLHASILQLLFIVACDIDRLEGSCTCLGWVFRGFVKLVC